MIVNVAGAGAGKTTKMADYVLGHDVPFGKIVFCIAFTNAAAENIKQKVASKLGGIPNYIKISTIHSFLYQELIEPYYYFLYGKQYKKLSTIHLPADSRYKAAKLAELESADILHVTRIPEKAKWVVYQKSRDTKATKDIRKRILSHFNSYCSAIYVDEAQDINEDIHIILSALEDSSAEIILYGDPKQDVKGNGRFRQIIDNASDVRYISDCHRCPQVHLDLSNTLASDNEKQVADCENAAGRVEIIFESDLANIKRYIESANFGLCYISHKNERFNTHGAKEVDDRFETLHHEVFRAMEDKWEGQITDIEIERAAFYVTEKILESHDQAGNAAAQIAHWIEKGAFDQLSTQRYAQMATAILARETETESAVVVKSIEIIKGLEAERCLFVLTSDLAPYLFRAKTEDNRMSHLLYVALTRSKNHLTIMISQEVEKSFSRESIVAFFRDHQCKIEGQASV